MEPSWWKNEKEVTTLVKLMPSQRRDSNCPSSRGRGERAIKKEMLDG